MSKQILPHNIQGFGKSTLADIIILAELDDNSLNRTCELIFYFLFFILYFIFYFLFFIFIFYFYFYFYFYFIK
jgi:hypothetical protein